MAFPKPFFSSVWRIIKRAAPALLWIRWVVAALLGLLCLFILFLHFYIVPYIDDFRPRLAAFLSEKTQANVRIESLEAQSSGLFPTFTLRRLEIERANAERLLSIPYFYADITWRSALRLAFAELRIDNAFLSVTRTDTNEWNVGGFTLKMEGPSSPYAQDWFFSQHHVRIRNSKVVLRDANESSQAVFKAPMALNIVLAQMRNTEREHTFDVKISHGSDIPSPYERSGVLALHADMRQAPLQLHPGDWRNWRGNVQMDTQDFDIAGLLSSAQIAPGLQQGRLNLTSTWTLNKGAIEKVESNWSLDNVVLRKFPEQAAVSLKRWQADVSYQNDPRSIADREGTHLLRIRNWSIDGGNAGRWTLPPTELRQFALKPRTERIALRPIARADDSQIKPSPEDSSAVRWQADIASVPLGLLGRIFAQAPLPNGLTTAQKRLAGMQPRGTVQNLVLGFNHQQTRPHISGLDIRGRIEKLSLAAFQNQPGIGAVDLDFKVEDQTGTVKLNVQQGWLDLPGIFDEGRITLDTLSSQLRWTYKRVGQDVDFDLSSDDIVFSNADAQGRAKLRWRSVDAKTLAQGGLIDLSGTLTRGNAAQVYRYLPKTMAQSVRDYVQSSVLEGELNQANFKVKGPVALIPYPDKRKGIFQIETKLNNLDFAYLPDALRSAEATALGQHWPQLQAMSGTLSLDGSGLKLSNAQGRLEGAANVLLSNVNAEIKSFSNPTVEVQSRAQGPITQVLERVQASPLQAVVGETFTKATVAGNANYELKLTVPLGKNGTLKVAGAVDLQGNTVQLSPDIPALESIQGRVQFSEQGFEIPQAKAFALGGPLSITGAMLPNRGGRSDGASHDLAFSANGEFSGAGLRQARSLGFLANAAQYLEGQAPYSLKVNFQHGMPEIDFQSSMLGIRSTLPEPLGKNEFDSMPIHYQSRVEVNPITNQKRDRFALNIGETGEILQAQYERDLAENFPKVTRGSIGIGLAPGESPPEPETGVGASVQLNKINTTDWLNVFAALTRDEEEDTLIKVINPQALNQLELTQRRLAALTYLPNVLAVRAQELTVQNRSIRNLLVGGSRENATWRANILADGVSGYAEYTQPEGKSAGHIYARLPQLTLGAQEISDVKTIVETKTTSVPSMDIVVDDLHLDKLALGKIVINAENIAQAQSTGSDTLDRESQVWRLNEMSMTLPEAKIEASGVWAFVENPSTGVMSRNTDGSYVASLANEEGSKRIRTQFSAQSKDIGALLRRFGLEDLHQGGSGNLKGHITWIGSPFAIDYPTLGGQMSVDVQKGQILKVDPGAGKLLGLFSLQFLPRLLTLDLRNEFGKGFAYDTLKGNIVIDQGVALTSDTVMDSASLARVEIKGNTNVATTEQDLNVKVVPQISLGSAAVAAGLFNPALFVLFPAQWVAGKWLAWFATEDYHVQGDWANPVIEKVKK